MDLTAGESERGWSATLELELGANDGRTVLERRLHRGPLQVQRAFYPEGERVAHVYVLHPPGGVVGADELTLRAAASAGAHALLTTPAATKLYRSAGKLARVRNVLRVAAGAVIEWLPGETLAFDGAHVDLSTRVELEPGAAFVGWEILGLGRPAAGERFDDGRLAQRFELWRGGAPLMIERARYAGGAPVLEARWGLAGYSVSATLAATPAGADALDAVRSSVAPGERGAFAATLLGPVLVARVLSPGAAEARSLVERVWHVLRPRMLGLAACPPRIWKT